MTNKQKIQGIIRAKGRVTSSELVKDTGVSRQYVHQVISDLIAHKEVVKIGGTRNAFYVSKDYIAQNPDILPSVFKKTYRNQNLEEHKVLMEIEESFPKTADLPENIKSIFTFAFSEMFNNAIEHSKSKTIKIEVAIRDSRLSFLVDDSGIGVFRNIMKKKQLQSEVQAIQDLLKGKTTTMPKSHSGEGIFFTSKSADIFTLNSFGNELTVTNKGPRIKDLALIKRGTRVIFKIALDSGLHLNDVFRRYTNLVDGSDYGFDKTEIRVRLYTVGGVHISRSQARRILSGLDKFKIILLDFEDVAVIGQAFADEIYRVFQNTYPDIEIKEENMSEGVKFMIERAKNESKINR